MSKRPELSIVIPAYDEALRIEKTLRETASYTRARGVSTEILVVDDGSHDRTSSLVLELSDEIEEIQLIRLAANRGKGHAVRSGVVNAKGKLVLFMDADGATPVAELGKLEEAIAKGADIAIGSRAMGDDGVEIRTRLYRKLIGRAFHLLVGLLTVSGFRDTQCGFKLFRADAAHDLFSRMRMDGFSFDVEVLLMARQRGYLVDEIPVNWVHQPGSRVNLVLDSLKMARDLFTIRSHALRGTYSQPQLAPLRSLTFESAEATKRQPVGSVAAL